MSRIATRETTCTLCGGEFTRDAAAFNRHILELRHLEAVREATARETVNHELNRCRGRGCWCTA